ncbi:heavy metal sensor histidine kinase [Massilia aerilata]|uniref:Sensor protein n=1 Tax=Massilia aerilata TaxID=453817 RepID=A0ABW0RWB5_9BURK
MANKLGSPRRWSLTARMSVFFGTAIAVVLIGVSAMMYSELVHQLHEKEEAELRADLQIQQEVLDDVVQKKLPNHWQHEWVEYQDTYRRFAWQLIGADGRVRDASSNASVYGQARHVLTVSVPVGHLAGNGAQLRGMLDVSQDQRVLRAYGKKLIGVVALAILFSAGMGWILARRGLAPVRAISAEIGRVNAEQLHARIANNAWPAELRQLATAFDDMLARLERSFEQLSRFSSDLAHEFRSPINNLVAAASVTLARARDSAEYQKTLEVVVEEGERLSRMVSSMLFLARADNAEQGLRLEKVSLAVEFRKLAEFYEIAAEENGVKLEASGACELPADPLLLRRALSNLLANALRYTGRGGTVRLLAARQGDAVVISVTDDGAGIEPEHLPFLFDRFYRADASRSSAETTGLGLAVVRSIVELHGGTASVTSRRGQGTCFTLVFPIAAAVRADLPARAGERPY